ncbi:MAG: adenylyl-sulfate kinase [Burkholderiales bacterium]|nr:adenylyl-sulfate kinase [Burkholderiales bacterium]
MTLQRSLTWWFTGLPSAGKTTLAQAWCAELRLQKCSAVVLDGDELRKGLTRDLGLSNADRAENMRRVAEVAKLFNQAGTHALVALVSPTVQGRNAASEIIGPDRFVEVFVSTPLAVCQQRDPKGLYARAASHEQFGLTGVQSPYAVADNADLVIDTTQTSVAEALALLLATAPRQLRTPSVNTPHST